MASNTKNAAQEDPNSKVWDLEKETELRISCRGAAVEVCLQDGVAEVFGVEMKKMMVYKFYDTSIALFTWYGAKVKVTNRTLDDGSGSSGSSGSASSSSSSSGASKTSSDTKKGNAKTSSSSATGGGGSNSSGSSGGGTGGGGVYVYKVSDSHMMQEYVQLHGSVDEVRASALSDADTVGPRVIVVGPPNSGKSTLIRLLCAYAVRMSRVPLLVDLDVSAGDNGVPGSLMTSPVDMRCVSVEHGIRAKYPLAYYYGHADPTHNPDLFKRQVDAMAKTVDQCLAKNRAMQNSGMIVNACTWSMGGTGPKRQASREVVMHCVRVCVCVCDHWHWH